MPLVGSFRCGNALVNQLNQNILWGQKGQLCRCSQPTAHSATSVWGWTGDTQVFAKTACYNMEMASF
jgi:alpha-L-rhamnosidase